METIIDDDPVVKKEITSLEDSENSQNQASSDYGACSSSQHEEQTWNFSCKKELDHSSKPESPVGSYNSDIMDEEKTIICPNTALYNGLDTKDYILSNENTTTDDLRQFDVLDDLDRHSEQDGSEGDSDTDESMDSDVPDEEIEAMLEEGTICYQLYLE